MPFCRRLVSSFIGPDDAPTAVYQTLDKGYKLSAGACAEREPVQLLIGEVQDTEAFPFNTYVYLAETTKY